MRFVALIIALLFIPGCATRALTDEEKKSVAAEVSSYQQSQVAAAAEREAAERSRITAEASEAARKAQEAKDHAARSKMVDTVGGVTANLTPMADVVSTRGNLPEIANGMCDIRDRIYTAMGVPPENRPPPTVTVQGLLDNAKAELNRARAEGDALQRRLDSANADAAAAKAAAAVAADAQRKADAEAVALRAAREAADRKFEETRKELEAAHAKADAEATSALWAKIGSYSLMGLTALAGIAAKFGLPGGGLVKTILDIAMPGERSGRAIAETAVAGADVGRSALSALEDHMAQVNPELADKLSEFVSAATKGKAEGVTDLFKLAAKAHVLDNAGEHAGGVDSLLTKIRGEVLSTKGGVPDTILHILKAVS